MTAPPTLCNIVRAEIDRGDASVANSLASTRDLAFQTRYSPQYIGDRAARNLEVANYANNVQQKEWKLAARYGAAAPVNAVAWWRYPFCRTPPNLVEKGMPYYDRDYLTEVAGYQPWPLLQLPAPGAGGIGGAAAAAVDAVVPDEIAARMPLLTDRIAEPKLAIVLIGLCILAYFAAIWLVVFVNKRGVRAGLRRAAKAQAAAPKSDAAGAAAT